MFITFSPFGAIVAKGSEVTEVLTFPSLSHSLIILYQIEHIMSSFFLHHTYLYQPKVMQIVTRKKSLWKGIEPHQSIGHQCFYTSLDLSCW